MDAADLSRGALQADSSATRSDDRFEGILLSVRPVRGIVGSRAHLVDLSLQLGDPLELNL
jgi:hypothetical protein